MERNVVNQKLLWILEGRKHVRNFFRHGGELFTRGAFGSKNGGPPLEDRPGFKHVLKTKTVKLRQQPQRLTVERGRTIDYESARALSRLQHTHPNQGAKTSP